MASIFSVNISKVNPARCLNRLCKITENHNVVQVAFMTRTANMKPAVKPAPFPYWKKQFTALQNALDPMVYRFDENTRLVVVDGPPAVGKTKVCEKLAAAFGMLYMPPPVHEQLYINQHGFDRRTLDPQLPLNMQSYDISKFLKNPTDRRAGLFQEQFLWMRYDQYMNALLHLLSTGQGVVLNRCFFSDLAFAITMKQAGYISENLFSHYSILRNIAAKEIPRPHITIYLDVPVQDVQEKIRRRARSEEANTEVFSTKFLTNLENAYKHKYLKSLNNHTYILAYDWSREGDVDAIINDIEKLDIDDETNTMIKDWCFGSLADVAKLRALACYGREELFCEMAAASNFLLPPEIVQTPEEEAAEEEVWKKYPVLHYEPGFLVEDKAYFKGNPKLEREAFRSSHQDFINRGY
ncbi:NADH dehydrogenase (ubiquinone) subunit ND-42 [Augochlora pura]